MRRVIICSLFALPLAVAYADHPRGPHQPPQEAIDACANAKRGDSCTVTHDSHSMTGVCDAPPDSNAPLACRPDGPPPEAVAACASSKEGDSCSVTFGDHTMPGTCAKGPDASKPLACRPEHPPHH